MTTLRDAAQQFVADYENGDLGDLKHYARALRDALAQEEQEPVAWLRKNGFRFIADIEPQDDSELPLYTHPPRRTGLPHCERSCEANAFQIEIRRLTAQSRREWRNLTMQEINDLPEIGGVMWRMGTAPAVLRAIRAVEAALKGKNA